MIDTNLIINILKAIGEYSKEDFKNVQRSISPDEGIEESIKERKVYSRNKK